MTLKLGEYWSTPLPQAGVEPEMLSAALSALCRGPRNFALKLERFEERPARMRDLRHSKYNAARLLAEIDPTPLRAAREALKVLQAALGDGGTVHDVGENGLAGTRPVTLSELAEQLAALEEQYRELVADFQPPAPVVRAGRVAA
jgi:hypothetical protein